MNPEVDSVSPDGMDGDCSEADLAAIERRIFRIMCGVIALAVCLSAFVAPWRVTTGLLLGGLLSLLNFNWIRSFVRGVFSSAKASGEPPRWNIARYFLRYFFLAGVIAIAYWLNLVSLIAVLAGLCAFAAAGMIEGFIQIYFAIIKGRET